MLKRIYDIEKMLLPNKVILLYGPRQVGKTTLLKNLLNTTKLKYKAGNGDSVKLQQLFRAQDFETILEYAKGYELITIDEAQKIPKIGQGLKILVDNVKNIKIFVTGSSSFELAQQTGEPLTGRKRTKILYPLSQIELLNIHNNLELKEKLEELIVFGFYPEVITANSINEKTIVLEEIVDSYLLKDVLAMDNIKKPDKLIKLLKLLAFQVGSEVSIHELAIQLKIDVKTTEKYLDILEKAFVIKNLSAYSTNLRKEITTKNKIYFYDTGIRNAIINNYNLLEDRNDVGALWENFLIMERIKKQEYKNIYSNNYFWRTYTGKEVDWIEERDGKLFGYEFKWNKNKKIKASKLWLDTYDNAEWRIITPDNYLDFIL